MRHLMQPFLISDVSVANRLLGQLLGQRSAVCLSGLCVFLSLCCVFDPLDQSGVTVSVLLQGRAQSLQIGSSAAKQEHSTFIWSASVCVLTFFCFFSCLPCLHLSLDSAPPLGHLIGSVLVALQLGAAV